MNLILVLIIIIIIILFLKYLKNKEFFYNKKELKFLHIPKNAGSYFKKIYPQFNNDKHYNAIPYKNKINIAIIRNPYDRLISIFSHLKDRTNKKTSSDLKEFSTIQDICYAYYDKNNINHTKARHIFNWNINEFNKYKEIPWGGTKHLLYGCGRNFYNNNIKCIHWCPQSIFIDDYKKVQYLIKFENLESDILKLQNKGILKKIKNTSKINVSPKSIKNKNKISSIVKKLVDDLYKDDFELWNKSGIK
jgi:hypothetical protein